MDGDWERTDAPEVAVRSILQAYGSADPTDFATKLHKAS
jgi:hypothetical protein